MDTVPTPPVVGSMSGSGNVPIAAKPWVNTAAPPVMVRDPSP